MREFELMEGNNSESCGSLFVLVFGSVNIPLTGCSVKNSCTVASNPHPKLNNLLNTIFLIQQHQPPSSIRMFLHKCLQVMPHPATHTEWFRRQHFPFTTGFESKEMTHKPEIRSGSNLGHGRGNNGAEHIRTRLSAPHPYPPRPVVQQCDKTPRPSTAAFPHCSLSYSAGIPRLYSVGHLAIRILRILYCGRIGMGR